MAQLMTDAEKRFYEAQIELAKMQLKYLKSQEEISKRQIKISESQNLFSRALMLATVVLAVGTFLTLTIEIIKFNWGDIVASIGIVYASIFAFFFIVFFSIMGFLVWQTLNLLLEK